MFSEGETGEILDTIVERLKQINALNGQLLHDLAEYQRTHEQPEFAAAELALTAHWTESHTKAQLALATDLAERLPATLAAVQAGQIDTYKAKTLAELTLPLNPEQTQQVETKVLAVAPNQNASTMRQYTRRTVHRIDPDGAERRHRRCVEDRKVRLTHQDNGMAELWAYLPAHLAMAIYDKVSTAASQARTPGDERTADQRRADAFADICLGDSSIRAQIQVTVAAATLLGLDNQPAELAGHGIIPASMAREIAAEGTWRRILTDPASGMLLDVGRRTYRPPTALADHVRTRDKTCRFPSCLRPAVKCDLDHHVPYPAGPTSATNLTALCRHHHRLKHAGNWQSKRLDDGTVIWKSPTGRQYSRAPEPVLASAPTAPAETDDPPPF